MTQERLKYLLNQQQSGLCTQAETEELESWYQAFDKRGNFTDGLSQDAQLAAEKSLFSKINSRIDGIEIVSLHSEKPVVKIKIWQKLYKIASVFTAILLAGYVVYQYTKKPDLQHQITAFGETRMVQLPDGSQVTLNGNSEITYPGQWNKGASREVFLKGEAYFQVVHTKDDRRFIVKTSDDFNVEVLGTKFVISKRKSGTRVVLNEGKVQCNLANGDKKDTLLLKPGDLIEFAKKPELYTRKVVNSDLYSSWKDHVLTFKNTPLSTITTMLEETYGLVVKADNPELLTRQISGSVPTDNVKILLEGIAETCHLKVHQEAQNIYLTDLKTR